jgi:hypothetical protein
MSCGYERGDKARIRLQGKTFRIVIVGHSDFPGYLEVAWPKTRHISKVRVVWLEDERR